MQQIRSHKPIVNGLHEITSNYTELLSYDFPILYAGRNKFGNRILGSIIEEDDDEGILLYYHLIVTDDAYSDFVNRIKTLRTLIVECAVVFIVQKDYTLSIIDADLIDASEIECDSLPLEDSYCPTFVNELSYSYGVSLKGKKADNHMVRVTDVNMVQANFENVLKNALDTIGHLDIEPQLYLRPSKVGSYRINFDIEIENPQTSIIPINKAKISSFLKDYFNYLINQLPSDSEISLSQNRISKDIVVLIDKLKDIYLENHVILTIEEIKEILLNSFNHTGKSLEALDIQMNTSNSFDRIEFINYQPNGDENSLGIIDDKYYSQIESKLQPVEETDLQVIETDKEIKSYRILVYQFNTNTGNGLARLYYDASESFDYIRINVLANNRSLEKSIFSNSLNEKKVVDVKGYAVKVDNKYARLKIPV